MWVSLFLLLLGGPADTATVLIMERSVPSEGVGYLTVRRNGAADFRSVRSGARQVVQLDSTDMAGLRLVLRKHRLCRIRSEPRGRQANYVTLTSRWPGMRCRVRRTEAGWRALRGGGFILREIERIMTTVCGAAGCRLGEA